MNWIVSHAAAVLVPVTAFAFAAVVLAYCAGRSAGRAQLLHDIRNNRQLRRYTLEQLAGLEPGARLEMRE